MPYVKRRKMLRAPRSRRRGRYNRRRRVYRRSRNTTLSRPIGGAINLSKSPLPETFKTILRYTDYNKLDVLLNNNADAHVVCLNGMYDPDITFIGHQPRGFDQMMALYGKYMVIGAKLTYELVNTSTVPVQVGYSIMNTTTTGSFMSDYMEGCTDVQYQTLGAAGTSIDRYKGVIKFSPKKYFSKGNLSDDAQMVGTISANPSLLAYAHIWVASNGASANQLNTVFLTYTIEYIAVLKEPKLVAAS